VGAPPNLSELPRKLVVGLWLLAGSLLVMLLIGEITQAAV
jgi:hypothetical protein